MRTFIFDTETTKLIGNLARDEKKQPKIIEFYGCVLEDEKVINEIDFLCDPKEPLSEETTRITNIKDEMVKGEPPFSNFAGLISDTLLMCDEIVAHNLAFDLQVLKVEFERAGTSFKIPKRKICTVEATEHFFGYRLNLAGLHTFLFGEAFEGAHRAKTDVQALTRCFVELRKRGEL